jgi:hypothetical protein
MRTSALTPARSPRRGSIIRRSIRRWKGGDCREFFEQIRGARLQYPLPGGESQGEGEGQP